MAGLLNTEGYNFYSLKFVIAVVAELLGVLLFAFYGDTTPKQYAAWGNGLALAIVVFITANISGGHVNPSVTIATMLSGHITLLKGACYIVSQILGSILASLLVAGLVSGVTIASHVNDIGVFYTRPGVSLGQAFGFECIMTFTLVSVVYAVAIGEPHFGNIGPFAIGLAQWAGGFGAGNFTGGAFNPARLLGPAIVFHARWHEAWVYVLAELLGGALAAGAAVVLYGVGPDWARLHDHSATRPKALEDEETAFRNEGVAASQSANNG